MKNIRFTLIIFSILGFAISCQQAQRNELEEAQTEEKINDEKTKVVNFADAPQKLSKWFEYQQKINPNFSVSDFQPSDTIQQKQFMEIKYPKKSEFDDFVIYSPDKEMALDLYSYQHEIKKNKEGETEVVAGSPDSQVILFSNNFKTAERLLFCGTTCHFEDGYWISDNELVISGAMESENMEKKVSMWHINLQEKKIVTFLNSNAKVDFTKGLYSDDYFGK